VVSAELQEAPGLQDFVAGWELYRDPVLAGVLAGATLAALGVFVLLRRAVFVTAAVSQAAGLGVALAFFAEIQLGIHVSPVFGALALAVSCTLAVVARTPRRFSRETLVGLFFVGASALAVLIGDRIAQEAHDVAAILFGTAVLVRPVDLLLLAIGSALAATALLFLQRALTFTGMDPDGARVQGLPVSAIETVFWSVLALEVSFATRALGSLPVFAFAVLPSAAGLLLADRVVTALVFAAVVGASAGGLGYLTAFLGDLPVGASQASVAMALTLVAYGVSRVVRRNS
jgi:zinc transport system permease protein